MADEKAPIPKAEAVLLEAAEKQFEAAEIAQESARKTAEIAQRAAQNKMDDDIARLELEAQVRELIGGKASIEVFANTKDTDGPVGELHARVGKMIFRNPLGAGRIDVQEISTGCWITISTLDEVAGINPA
jgi:hypothetical protein